MAALDASAVAALLREFKQRSALRGGNPFRVKAYARAADSLLALSLPIDEIIALIGCAVAAPKSTVRKPSSISAKLANEFENRPMHSPPYQKEMETHHGWEGCFGKRAPVPHHRFVVPTNCSFPS